MGYIYEAMERAKETIQLSFDHNEEKYKDIFAIIDKRWDCQLHHPLDVAGYYLSLEFDDDDEVVDGLFKCIDRLSENDDIVDNIHTQLLIHKRARGKFDIPVVVRARVRRLLVTEWWKKYGGHTPQLQNLAIKVLSLTCSSSGCKGNWSTFEHRSKPEHQKLQDLVFIKYNQALQEHFKCWDVIDPIVLNDVDDNNEWMLGGDLDDDGDIEDGLVFDDVLTSTDVAEATWASEPLQYTRRQTQVNKATIIASTSRKEKGKKVMEVIEKDLDDDDHEVEEEYNSNSGSDEFEKEEDFNFDEEED
uniref:HAT C-terminal dimerisation domain-containing protein n=1 Tax=Cajanus cajan TaxID=3821 RepID=A0A151QQV2_CAJCA|nr:hypothetical protein KK1_046594 [Cajanus cajan]